MARLAALLLCFGLLGAAPPSYETSIQSWRAAREESLKAKDGWLTVAGLFWLHPGRNVCGSDPKSDVLLPAGRAPARVGVFTFENGKTHFQMFQGVHILINGKPAISADLQPDTSEHPDQIQIGDFTMFIIKRGDRFGVRVKDINSQFRREFTGLRWYPVKPQYRVIANWTSSHGPRKIAIPNILGQTEYEPSPGYATFDLMGHSYRLDPTVEERRLFFVFRDGTSGKTTYGAGRFLYADMPKEGKVVLDFNKAYSPPCAFTPYATCPLPPRQNRLTVKIEAGELKYGNH
jgi:hypothetical protein